MPRKLQPARGWESDWPGKAVQITRQKMSVTDAGAGEPNRAVPAANCSAPNSDGYASDSPTRSACVQFSIKWNYAMLVFPAACHSVCSSGLALCWRCWRPCCRLRTVALRRRNRPRRPAGDAPVSNAHASTERHADSAKPKPAAKKTPTTHKSAQPTSRATRLARTARIKQAFVASKELQPMAQQLATLRTPAAYAGVTAYAHSHTGEAAAAAYLALGPRVSA